MLDDFSGQRAPEAGSPGFSQPVCRAALPLLYRVYFGKTNKELPDKLEFGSPYLIKF